MEEQDYDNKKVQQIALLQKLIRNDEKEREEISYELHENIAQLLAAVRLHLNIAKKHMNEEGLAFLQEAEMIIQQSLSGVKTLAKLISPITLKSAGFKMTIDGLFTLLVDQKDLNYHISIDEEAVSRYSIQFQNLFYQIAQFQLIHILNLDDVSTVNLSVLPLGSKLKLKILYDGHEKVPRGMHTTAGFISVKEKIEAFDGTVQIFETPFKDGMVLEVVL